jgi:uncharacterized protein
MIKTVEVMMVRIYISESSHLLKQTIEYLQNEAEIRGFTVFRAISGYGEQGELTSSLVDLFLNLPLVIEFFDHKEKIQQALTHLNTVIKHEHIVFWPAYANE